MKIFHPLLKERQRLRNRIESALLGQGYRAMPKTAKRLAAWWRERSDGGEYLKSRPDREVARLARVEAHLREVDIRQAQAIQTEGGSAAAAGAVLRMAQALSGKYPPSPEKNLHQYEVAKSTGDRVWLEESRRW